MRGANFNFGVPHPLQVDQHAAGLSTVVRVSGRGLHSSTFKLNLSRFRYKIHLRHSLMPSDTSQTPCKTPKCTPYLTQSAYVAPNSGRV